MMDNPDTTDCIDCNITSSTNTSQLTVGQPLLNSYFTGTYTCTVTENGRPNSSSGDNFTVTVIGK